MGSLFEASLGFQKPVALGGGLKELQSISMGSLGQARRELRGARAQRRWSRRQKAGT